MKVVSLSVNDYANYMHENAKALRSVGVDCQDFIQIPHVFKYQTQGKLANRKQMIQHAQQADIVQINDSHPDLFNLVQKYCTGKIVVYHIGTRYRENHEVLNNVFSGYQTITDQTEFMSLGNHEYVVSPVELELAPIVKDRPYIVGHYPSNPIVKGTDSIIEMLSQVKTQFRWAHSLRTVDHRQQLSRVSACDIYIELFKPEINSKKYGCFGVTALEAAAMGKIVVTNNLFPDVYRKVYGTCPMSIINTRDNFINYFNQILKMEPDHLRQLQRQTHEIMRENHSYTSTGNRLKKILGI